jgi:hypothetical protein
MKPNIGLTQAVLDDLRAKGIDVRTVNRTQRDVHGIATELVSAEAAEQSALVICGYPPAAFPDEDLLTWCHDCQCAIVHRPHAPKTPIKVCLRCAKRRLESL